MIFEVNNHKAGKYLCKLSDIMKKCKTLKALHNNSKKGRRDQNNLYWAFPSIVGQKLSFQNLLSNTEG